MVRSMAKAKQDLADVAPLIEGAIRRALERFTSEHRTRRRYYSRRTQSSVVHDLMVDEVKKALDGRPGITCLTAKGTFVVLVRQTYIIRLKKMGYRLRTSNIQTQTVLDFMNQRPMQMTIPSVPTETHLIFGYRQSGPELLTAQVWATCPMGGWLQWAWMLDAAAETPIIPARTAPTAANGSLYVVRDADETKAGKKKQ